MELLFSIHTVDVGAVSIKRQTCAYRHRRGDQIELDPDAGDRQCCAVSACRLFAGVIIVAVFVVGLSSRCGVCGNRISFTCVSDDSGTRVREEFPDQLFRKWMEMLMVSVHS